MSKLMVPLRFRTLGGAHLRPAAGSNKKPFHGSETCNGLPNLIELHRNLANSIMGHCISS